MRRSRRSWNSPRTFPLARPSAHRRQVRAPDRRRAGARREPQDRDHRPPFRRGLRHRGNRRSGRRRGAARGRFPDIRHPGPARGLSAGAAPVLHPRKARAGRDDVQRPLQPGLGTPPRIRARDRRGQVRGDCLELPARRIAGDIRRLSNGNVLFMTDGRLREIDLLGNTVGDWHAAGRWKDRRPPRARSRSTRTCSITRPSSCRRATCWSAAWRFATSTTSRPPTRIPTPVWLPRGSWAT